MTTTATTYEQQTLRPYQQLALDDAIAFAIHAEPGDSILYAAPTGSGKGTIQLVVRDGLRAIGKNPLILTPSLEVLRGYLERSGLSAAGSPAALAKRGQTIGVTTPVRFRNQMLKGEFFPLPDVLILDEAHHNVKSNVVTADLRALLPAACIIGYTATPFRGTAKGTQELRADWQGEPVEILNLVQAIECGAMQAPTATVVPLLDDDQIKIVNGEFQVKAATAASAERMKELANLVASYADPNGGWRFDVPTMVSVPSTECAHQLVRELSHLGVSAHSVLQDTKADDRATAYEMCKAREAALVQISVVSEGVDLPWLKRLVDAKPSMSPVAWLQQVGRICRPGGARPEYVCTNRNLERHSYLFDGAWPREYTADAQKAFDGPTSRSGARFLGLKGLGKFKTINVPLIDGSTGTLYILWRKSGGGMLTDELACLVLPGKAEPITATRRNTRGAAGRMVWGTWTACELPDEVTGYGTSPQRGELSDKQRAWWQRSAAQHGLDPEAADDISKRTFAVLPILSSLRVRAEVGR